MGKLLRVLVVFLLLFSIGGLVLGSLLFAKRELLKGRAQNLERTVTALAATFEENPATLDAVPTHEDRDLSPCTDQPVDTPERSRFWSTYSNELEKMNLPTLQFNTQERQQQLMQFYKLDPDTGRPMRDPVTGYKITKGDGTMQQLLDLLLDRAQAQLTRLNATRQQLIALRGELESAIKDLNERKRELRTDRQTITKLKSDIARLEQNIRDLNQKIVELEDAKRALEEERKSLKETIVQLQQEIKDKDLELKARAQRIEELEGIIRDQIGGGRDPGVGRGAVREFQPGAKGAVQAVNPNWNYVVISVTPEFIKELEGRKPNERMPSVDLILQRPGPNGAFVAKVRLVQIKKDQNLAVANILPEWQQLPIQKGDAVIYQ